jgi:hypothetical protein
MAKGELSFVGGGPNAISLGLLPGREALAARVRDRFGDAVEIQVGLTHYCGHPGLTPRCTPLAGPSTLPTGLSLTLRLQETTAKSTAAVVHGTLTVRQAGPARLDMDTGQPLLAVVVRPRTLDVVARYGGAVAGTGYRVTLTNGQQKDVPVLVGPWKCDGTTGSALAAGHYGVRVAIGDHEGQIPRYLAPEVPLTITNG